VIVAAALAQSGCAPGARRRGGGGQRRAVRRVAARMPPPTRKTHKLLIDILTNRLLVWAVMESTPQYQPDPAVQLQQDIYALAAEILRATLPPPLVDTPEAWARRDRVALAAVAALVPGNPAEAKLAARHVAEGEHADDCLRLAAQHAADLKQAAQLRAQAASMSREARGCLSSLLRLQAVRKKREANDATRDSAAITEHCVFGLMTDALERAPPRPPAAAVVPAAAAAAAPPAEKVRYRDYSEWSKEEQQADRLRADADRWAILNTVPAKRIRQHGGLPPDCDFEPPAPEVLQAIINGNTSTLRWADTYEPWVAAAE